MIGIYDESAKYTDFILAKDSMDIELNAFLQECELIRADLHNTAQMGIITEAFNDNIKALFQKFKDFFMKIWNKFTTAVNGLIMSNKSYLEKYKDIILKKKNPDIEVETFNYFAGMKTLIEFKLQPFNWQKSEETQKSELESGVSDFNLNAIYHYYPNYVNKLSKGDDWIGYLKCIFQGGQNVETHTKEKFNIKDMNMTDLFNFCYDYKKTYDTIDSNQKLLLSQTDAASSQLESKKAQIIKDAEEMSNGANSEKTGAGGDNQQDASDGNNSNGETPSNGKPTVDVDSTKDVNGGDSEAEKKANKEKLEKEKQQERELIAKRKQQALKSGNESVFYSRVYDTFIHEDEGAKPQTVPAAKTQTTSSPSAAVKVADPTNKSTENEDKEKIDKVAAAGDKAIDAMIKAVQAYAAITRDVVTSQMTVAEAANKAYFKIIKLKVGYYTAEDAKRDKGNDQDAQAGTAFDKSDQSTVAKPAASSGAAKAPGVK